MVQKLLNLVKKWGRYGCLVYHSSSTYNFLNCSFTSNAWRTYVAFKFMIQWHKNHSIWLRNEEKIGKYSIIGTSSVMGNSTPVSLVLVLGKNDGQWGDVARTPKAEDFLLLEGGGGGEWFAKWLWKSKEVYSFHLHRCATCKKFRDYFLFSNFINLLHEFIVFFLCSLIICSSVCYGKIRELHA